MQPPPSRESWCGAAVSAASSVGRHMSRNGCTHPSGGIPLLRPRRDRLHCIYSTPVDRGPEKRGEGNKPLTYKVAGLVWLLRRQLCPPGLDLGGVYPDIVGRKESPGTQEGTRASRRSADGHAKTLRPSRVVKGLGQGTRISQSVEQRLAALRCLSATTVDWEAWGPGREQETGRFKCLPW